MYQKQNTDLMLEKLSILYQIRFHFHLDFHLYQNS